MSPAGGGHPRRRDGPCPGARLHQDRLGPAQALVAGGPGTGLHGGQTGPGHRRYRRYRPEMAGLRGARGDGPRARTQPEKVRRTVAGITGRFRVPEVIGEVCDVSISTRWPPGPPSSATGSRPRRSGAQRRADAQERFVTPGAMSCSSPPTSWARDDRTSSPPLRAAAVRRWCSCPPAGTARLWWSDLESDHDYNRVRTYARTKRMQVVLADAWAHRMAGTDVKVESMHPGWVDTPGWPSTCPVPGHHQAAAA